MTRRPKILTALLPSKIYRMVSLSNSIRANLSRKSLTRREHMSNLNWTKEKMTMLVKWCRHFLRTLIGHTVTQWLTSMNHIQPSRFKECLVSKRTPYQLPLKLISKIWLLGEPLKCCTVKIVRATGLNELTRPATNTCCHARGKSYPKCPK